MKGQQTFIEIRDRLNATKVTLVAVSKTQPQQKILSIYNEGQRIFGENKVQELLEKYSGLPEDIEWHLIGHLQTNKVKSIAPFISLIQSVDSLKLLKEINNHAKQNNRIIDVLLQIYIAKEDSKFGLSFNETLQLIHYSKLSDLQNISIRGLMGMATFTGNQEQISSEFRSLKNFFEEVKTALADQLNSAPAIHPDAFNILSMGMSGDYDLAIAEGSNMVRIGSAIFGARNNAMP